MNERSLLSPLYAVGVTREHRAEIQAWNAQVIGDGFSRYTFQPGEVPIPLEGLSVNGVKSDQNVLLITYDPHNRFVVKVNNEQNKPLSRISRSVASHSMIDWAEEKIPFWIMMISSIKTTLGNEGNGFGTAIVMGSEHFVSDWARELPDPRRVVAHHHDAARSAEETSGSPTGYRVRWTGDMLQRLGYLNDRRTHEYYLGEERVKDEGINDRYWTKLLRE